MKPTRLDLLVVALFVCMFAVLCVFASPEPAPGHNEFCDEVGKLHGVMVVRWRNEHEGGFDIELDAEYYSGTLPTAEGVKLMRRIQAIGQQRGVAGPFFFSRHVPAVEE